MGKLATVVNLFGGPGSGKTTTAWALGAELKYRGVSVEYVPEWVKPAAYEKRPDVFWQAQQHIYGNQSYALEVAAKGGATLIVTDSPLLIGLCYMDNFHPLFEDMCNLVDMDASRYNNFNVFINRVKPYNPVGRNQTEEEAKYKDFEIITMLDTYGYDYITVNGDRDAASILADTLEDNGWL